VYVSGTTLRFAAVREPKVVRELAGSVNAIVDPGNAGSMFRRASL
jgi:hypothetical protein